MNINEGFALIFNSTKNFIKQKSTYISVSALFLSGEERKKIEPINVWISLIKLDKKRI